jgi:prepilin-type N-terminal cleavage/methylation domain-containing protein
MGRLRARQTSSGDGGFSLVEVVVAMALLTIVMTALAAFFIRGQTASNGLQRRESAIALANQTMEQVRSVSPGLDASGLNKLVTGRSQAAVDAQWASAPAQLATTTRAYDPGATASSVPVLALTSSQTVAGQPYTVDTFIGTCRQPQTAAACSNSAAASGSVTMYRIVVRVAWSFGAGRTCSGSACEYLLTTLMDPDSDQTFNSSFDAATPVATDDSVTTAFNTPVSINVLTNDTGTFNTTPVSITTAAAHGTIGGSASGTFTYTPTSNYSGTDTLSYRLTDSSGQISNIATVTITITLPTAPTARAITLTTPVLTATSVSLLTGNTGTFAASGAATLVSPVPTGGSVAANGTFSYTPPSGTSGAVVFTYRLTDIAGQTAQNTVTVTVTAPLPPAPIATGQSLCRNTGGTFDLMTRVTGTGLTPAGLTVDTSLMGGWTITGPTSTSGVVTITHSTGANVSLRFRITDPAGQTSNQATISLTRSGC